MGYDESHGEVSAESHSVCLKSSAETGGLAVCSKPNIMNSPQCGGTAIGRRLGGEYMGTHCVNQDYESADDDDMAISRAFRAMMPKQIMRHFTSSVAVGFMVMTMVAVGVVQWHRKASRARSLPLTEDIELESENMPLD